MMQSTSAEPERILTFGIYGSGKTNSWATIADAYRDAGLDHKFYVIGTERGSIGRLSDKYPNFKDNVEWNDVAGWLEMSDLSTRYAEAAQEGDWIVIEGIDKPWHWVQMLWDQLHGSPVEYDPRDPFAMERGVSQVERDWVKVNGVYRKWINNILGSPAHVFACGPQDSLRLPNPQNPKAWHDDTEVVNQYNRFGVRPAGQKELGHHFHTVLLMRNPRHKVWTVSTVDDHTREILNDSPLNNFVMDYLVKVARWTL